MNGAPLASPLACTASVVHSPRSGATGVSAGSGTTAPASEETRTAPPVPATPPPAPPLPPTPRLPPAPAAPPAPGKGAPSHAAELPSPRGAPAAIQRSSTAVSSAVRRVGHVGGGIGLAAS